MKLPKLFKSPHFFVLAGLTVIAIIGIVLLFLLAEPKEQESPPPTVTVNGSVFDITDYLCGCILYSLCYAEGDVNEIPAAGINAAAAVIYNNILYLQEHVKDKVTLIGLYRVGYLSPEQQQEHYGEQLEQYRRRALSAAKYALTTPKFYSGERVFLPLCRISSGALSKVSGLNYTKQLYCPQDKTARYYSGSCQLTINGIATRLLSAYPDMILSPDRQEWITDLTYDDNHNIISATLCGLEVSGFELRDLLGLRSVSFDMEYSEGVFSFTTYGDGDSCGMSVHSAFLLAQSGLDENEILNSFYRF